VNRGLGRLRLFYAATSINCFVIAVVKVTPHVGCVKYKAQHIVLAVRIPVLMGRKWPKGAKNGHFPCGFQVKGANFLGLTVSSRAWFEGRREGQKGQGAEGVQIVWIEGEWGGNVGKPGHQNGV
jgi:hypothetical protein